MPIQNRHSGDFFHWSPSRQLQEERRALRKSGDWSYVGFPDGPRNTSVVGSQVMLQKANNIYFNDMVDESVHFHTNEGINAQ